MISSIKTGLRAGLKNWTALLFFVLTYKIIGFTVIMDGMNAVKSLILQVLGISFIGQQNIGLVIRNPIALLMTAVCIVIFIYYVYLELVALFIYCEAGWQGETITGLELWKRAFLRSISLFHRKTLPAALVMIPLIGLSVFPLTYGFMNNLRIPEFILDYIYDSANLRILFAVCMIGFNLLAFFYLFSLPDAIVKKHGGSSLGAGAKLMRGRFVKTAAVLASCVLAFIVLAVIVTAAAVLLLWAWSKIPALADGGKAFFRFHMVQWSRIGSVFFSVLLPVSCYAAVITLYHQYRGDEAPPEKKGARTPKVLITRAAVVLSAILFLAFYSETELGGSFFNANEAGTEVVAHRAGGAFAPENTLAALRDSIDAGADMAEIDVQQTKDGVLIIMHDSNFRRTTGLDQAVWETDYDTVRTLDAGTFFSRSFAGERIPTLEEMLAAAKGRIRLMIELKSTGHEQGLVEKTVEQIRDAGMEHECVIASMDIGLLERSKELAPEIESVYISSLAFSQEFNLDYVDGYSVETSFLTLEMVTQIQYNKKKIYAWTANSEKNIRKIIRLGADGIITDNPSLADFYLLFYDKNYVVDDLTDMLYGNDS